MAYDIGPKLGIDGYAEFKKAITSINDEVKGFGSELKLVAAIYEQNGESMEALAAKNDVLQKTYDAQEKKLAEVAKVLEAAKAEYGENEAAVKKWEQVLTESKAALVKTQNEIEKNSKAMEELAKAAENSTEAFSGFDSIEKAVDDIDDEIKTLASELRAVASAYDESEKNSKGFKETQEVLAKQIDAQKRKLEQLYDGLKESEKLYGENDAETRKWARAVNDATAELNDMTNQLDKSNKGMSKFASGFKDAAKVAAGNLLSSGVSAVVDGAMQAASALINLDESTEEYRVAMGKLDTAFESSGYASQVATKAYKGLYAILGDTDNATESAQLMAQLSDSEADFAEWTNIAAGAAGVFGDSLPTSSMMEFLVETSKTGEITGDLSRMLLEAGISTEEFQAQLDACSTESERNTLLMETLGKAYGEAADAFYKNNEAVVEARKAQADLDDAMGNLGESVAKVKNSLMEKFGPAIANVADKAADFINNVDTEKLFKKFDTAVDNIEGAFKWGWDAITGIYDLAPSYFDGIGDMVGHSFDLVQDLWNGDFEGAWESVCDLAGTRAEMLFGTALDIKDMFSDLDWSFDFESAWSGAKAVFSDTVSFFNDVGQDIINAMAAGMSRAQREHTEFGGGDRSGAFGDSSSYAASRDNSAYYSANAASSVGNVYLDGKQVGKVLAGVNDASNIASGSEVTLLP